MHQTLIKALAKSRAIPGLVMLVLLVCVACTVFAADPKFPAYKGHVNDFAGVIDATTKDQLETILLNFEKRTGAQIAVVTVETLGETPIEDYALGLYRAWGIGAKTGENKNKGALLLIATQDRRSRLEVGYGLEGDLPDGLAGEMLRRMRPYFKNMAWSEGVTVGVRTLVDTLAQKWGVSLEGIDQSYAYSPQPQQDGSGALGLICGIFALFIIVMIIAGASRGGRGGGGGTRAAINAAAWIGPLILNRGGGGFGGGSWGGSSGGGGGDGGGWGGFGGGSSGGGGASDSW